MDTLGILGFAIGGYMVFEAIKNPAPTPIMKARKILGQASSTTPSTTNTLDVPKTTTV